MPETLIDTATMGEIIQHAGEKAAWWPKTYTWKRTFSHVQAPPVLTTLVFESLEQPQEIVTVEAWADEPPSNAANIQCIFVRGLGWLRILRFPADPALATLRNFVQENPQARVLRYRPGKRCTFSQKNIHTGEETFIKVFRDDRGEELHLMQRTLWRAFREGRLGFQVAEPLQWHAETLSLWQKAVPGKPVLKQLFGSKGAELAYSMGEALATLPGSDVVPRKTLDWQAQLRRSEKYAKKLRKRFPGLSLTLDLLFDRLYDFHCRQPEKILHPIHGSPHVHQWLNDSGHLGLVDFDRISYGDPELDVATFVAEMDFEKLAPGRVEKINSAFIAGYESRFGPLNRQLLNAYRAHKRLSKALKAAKSLRPDRARKAEQHLNFATECIEREIYV